MKSITTKGIICVKDNLNIEYRFCEIVHTEYEDGTFKYVFKPNHFVCSLPSKRYFMGIPGLNLDLKREEYIRENIYPVFVSERVPSEKREDYYELLAELGMEFMNPVEFMIRDTYEYSGDSYYVIAFEGQKDIELSEVIKKHNTMSVIKILLDNIAAGNKVSLNGERLNCDKSMFNFLKYTYEKSLSSNKEKQSEGIFKAKKNHKYVGRKPIEVDMLVLNDVMQKVEYKTMSSKEAAEELGVSIDKFYRLRRQKNNNDD